MRRLNEYKQTEAMAIDVMAKGMSGKVVNLAAGDPDLDVCDGLKKAYLNTNLDRTHNYGSSQGSPVLRALIWDKENEVIIADGAKELMYESLAATTNPGDKVVLIGPCWTSYMKICEILGIDYILLTGEEEDCYIPKLSDIEKCMSKDVAAVVINNPNNPTGAVYESSYVETLYDMAVKNDCWIIADEIYRFLSDVNISSLRGRDHAIVIDGFSKSLNITGWRMGYAIAEEKVIKTMTALQSQLSGPPSTLIQDILIRGWDELKFASYQDYKDRIDVLCENSKFKRHRPTGGFYFYVPIADRWESSTALCEYMLKEHRIAITPGDSYGVSRTVRISVASTNVNDIKEILEYMGEI